MALLDQIVASTRARVERLRAETQVDELEAAAAERAAPRGFAAALAGEDVAIIGEIKRISPLKGPLAPDLDPFETASAYARGGAAALSVLTEPEFFGGSLEDLRAVLPVGIPVMRKDFVVDPLQVLEARAAGADAVLLIVRVVQDDLANLLNETRAHGMDALVEVYDEADVRRALDAGASLVGVNNRDLATFEVDPDRTARLGALIPSDVTLAALSGVTARSDIQAHRAAGARAVLVGEGLVTASDPAAKLRELRGQAA